MAHKLATSFSNISSQPHSLAEVAARCDCPLLITGETGTGKGHLAQWIHSHSQRASAPFIPINCGAIPENLIDSHLFGHARGAFSDATADHIGLIRAAQGGTVLLDEISELPLTAQARLLRLLEEREVQPLGYSAPVKVNVRFIAATNSDLKAAVASGRFRPDLYFRLEVLAIQLQPLRDRCDLPELLNAFNREFADSYAQSPAAFTADAMQLLQSYAWPGNIRELRTMLERLYVLRGAELEHQPITSDDLILFGQLRIRPRRLEHGACVAGRGLQQATPTQTTQAAWRGALHCNSQIARKALQACRGNITRAASRLGVHRSTMYRWLASQPQTA